MAFFGILALLRFWHGKELFFLLVAMRDFIASWFLMRRRDAISKGPWYFNIIAYISSFVHLFYISSPSAYMGQTKLIFDLCAITGFLIVTLATIELGTKMGISPAKRGKLCKTGVYKHLKHPMYVGYTIAQIGWLLIDIRNSGIYALSLFLFYLRGRAERRLWDFSKS